MNTIGFIARFLALCILALFILRFFAHAQAPQQPDMTIDAATRASVIERLIKELNDGYVFVETAAKMEADLRSRAKNKEYDEITSAAAFAERLTANLMAISNDKHLRVMYSARPIPVRPDRQTPTAEEQTRFQRFNKRANFGFDRVERMDGNIGYIELRGFMDPKAGASTVEAAMSLVANTDALIFDLRNNGGGDARMVALISSYLFADRVHLNDLYFRPSNRTDEFWTDPGVPGRKFLDKDVYVLTSGRTFSAAEEFSNNLKVLKRAVIVGETTRGGANPGGMVRLSEHFGAFVPTGRAINPITKTNWEGVGVEPDVKVAKEQALNTAYLMALKKSHHAEKDPDLKRQLQELMDEVGRKILPAGQK